MKWLSRDLFRSPVYYGLCLDEKAFYRELKRLKVPHPLPYFVTPGSSASTHFFDESENNHEAAIVCIQGYKDRPLPEVIGLLVHESVHVWQAITDNINEQHPSSEFEAYSIQLISQEMVRSFLEQTTKKTKKAKPKKSMATKKQLKKQQNKTTKELANLKDRKNLKSK